MKSVLNSIIIFTIFAVFAAMIPHSCWGETQTVSSPYLSIAIDKGKDPGNVAVVLQIFFLLTILSLAPAILIMLTSFTRIAIVLSVLRQALGTNSMPPPSTSSSNKSKRRRSIKMPAPMAPGFMSRNSCHDGPLRNRVFKPTLDATRFT